jgi:NADH:ubiquinone oxidoreductase subunit C
LNADRTRAGSRNHDGNDRNLDDLASTLADELDGIDYETHIAHGELTVTTGLGSLIALLTALRDNVQLKFVSIIDICGADYPGRDRVSTSSTTCCRRR